MTTLTPRSLASSLDEQTVNPSFLEILAEVKTKSELQQEPQRLSDLESHLREQLIHASTQQYENFLTTQDLITQANSSLEIMAEKLKAMQTELLPTLQQDTQHFMVNVAPTLHKQRQKNKLCLSHYEQITQLLEIPQLAETCILNELYGEALDLDEYVRSLARGSPDVSILETLKTETEQVVQLNVLKRLIQHLKSPMNVHTCLKVVGHLRKLNVLSERELRVTFLQYRCIHIQNNLQAIPRKSLSAYRYCTQVTDTLKLQLFEMIMQYQAVFPTSSSTGVSSTSYTSSPSTSGSTAQSPSQSNFYDSRTSAVRSVDTILPSCIDTLLHPYIQLLGQEVQKIVSGEELGKLLEQCMYCGQTLARVGVDFRSLVVPIFVNRVQKLFEQSFADAISMFQNSLERFKWSEYKPSYSGVTPSTPGSTPATPISPISEQSPTLLQEDTSQAPKQLLSYIPVAELTNDLLRSLNELRICAPAQLKASLYQFVQAQLKNLMNHMHQVNFLPPAMSTSSETNNATEMAKQNYREMCKQLQQVLQPFILRCFEKIYNTK